jgi:hypothetical protein
MVRRHEVYSIEQHMQDEANVRVLITSIADSHEHEHDKGKSLSLSLSLYIFKGTAKSNIPGLQSLSWSSVERRRPVLVQTRASKKIISPAAKVPASLGKSKAKQRKQDTGVEKQRQSPLLLDR